MKDMSKTVLYILALEVVCAGCVSDPFVDECLARLDENPLSAKFELPQSPPTPIQPLSAASLVGEWWCVYTVYGRVEDATCRPLNEVSWIQSENFGFSSDGGYQLVQVIGQGFIGQGFGPSVMTTTVDEKGSWQYEEGVLTLDVASREAVSKFNGQEISRREAVGESKRSCQVKWFGEDEVAIMHNAFENPFTLPKSGDCRTAVEFDSFGAKTVRIIHITGTRDGREKGAVFELAYPPIHYKRNSSEASGGR